MTQKELARLSDDRIRKASRRPSAAMSRRSRCGRSSPGSAHRDRQGGPSTRTTSGSTTTSAQRCAHRHGGIPVEHRRRRPPHRPQWVGRDVQDVQQRRRTGPDRHGQLGVGGLLDGVAVRNRAVGWGDPPGQPRGDPGLRGGSGRPPIEVYDRSVSVEGVATKVLATNKIYLLPAGRPDGRERLAPRRDVLGSHRLR